MREMDKSIAAGALAAALFLGGCGGSGYGTVGPTNTASGNGNPAGSTPVAQKSTSTALFQPLQGILPFPTDLYFSGSTDGTLNIQPANALWPGQTALNALDGFSTTAVIRERFAGALNPASLTASSVIVVRITTDNTTKAPVPPSQGGVVQPLIFGTDYTVGVGPETGVGSSILEIRPSHPLIPSTCLSNGMFLGTKCTTGNGYLVFLTNGITDASGNVATPDTDYANIKSALPTCASITDTALNGICRLTGAHLQLARALGLNPANVVVSFSFTTESISDTLAIAAGTATAQPITAHNTGLTTAQADPRLRGHANIYVGTLSIPYYLSRAKPLTEYWHAAPFPLDPTSTFTTRFNPLPVATETLPIPVLVTVPNAGSQQVKPAAGWPVVIFQHGITRSRTDMLAVADAFADSGVVVVAIDIPLHGITDPKNPLYASAANPLYAGLSLPASGSIERTFDLDVVNNTTLAPGPDGQIDPSGASFINLGSLLTSRDNLRESAADLVTLTRSLPALSLGVNPAGDVDPTRIHFLGHSLGAMMGGVYLALAAPSDVRTGTLAMPGGQIAQLLRDSPTFAPRIFAGLRAQSQGLLVQGTTGFEQFFRDAQTVVDSGDPINYVAGAAANHPIHLIQVVGGGTVLPDQVIPNSATQRLITAAGLTRIPAPATPGPAVSMNGSPPGHRAYVNFLVGDHGSIVNPAASLAATREMQGETITFTGAPIPTIFPPTTPGTVILIGNPTVIQP
jgi:hypothetical protein